eukprot:2050645-Prymnesium_polylepis.1
MYVIEGARGWETDGATVGDQFARDLHCSSRERHVPGRQVRDVRVGRHVLEPDYCAGRCGPGM